MDRELEDLDAFIDLEDGAEFPWPLVNKDKRLGMIKEAHRRWLAKHGKQPAPKPDRRAYHNEYVKKRRATDPEYRAKCAAVSRNWREAKRAEAKEKKPRLPSVKDDPEAFYKAIYQRKKHDEKRIAYEKARAEACKERRRTDPEYRAYLAFASKRSRERRAAREAAAKEGTT